MGRNIEVLSANDIRVFVVDHTDGDIGDNLAPGQHGLVIDDRSGGSVVMIVGHKSELHDVAAAVVNRMSHVADVVPAPAPEPTGPLKVLLDLNQEFGTPSDNAAGLIAAARIGNTLPAYVLVAVDSSGSAWFSGHSSQEDARASACDGVQDGGWIPQVLVHLDRGQRYYCTTGTVVTFA
jgi:hypothetical protein